MSLSYKIKIIKEDFIVNEVFLEPRFFDKDKSQFTYIWMEKRGLTTFDALDKIRGYFNLNHEDLSYQGLKDEDGITRQLVSVKNNRRERNIKI
jgi:tRNA pseudouridine13 synthase